MSIEDISAGNKEPIKHRFKAFMIMLSRKIYQRIPLKNSKKTKLKSWVYSRFPWGFSHTLSYRFWKSNLVSAQPDAVGMSDYERRLKNEITTFAGNINVHDLPEIFHYWSNKYLQPIFKESGIASVIGFFANNLLECALHTRSAKLCFVSIGSGNCDLEIKIAKELLQLGCDNFVLECLEINPAMLERGREQAKQEGVESHLVFTKADFNTWKPTKIYDGVMANQSLHHVSNLEHLFAQVYKSLHDKGGFVISDIIGRNGHQRWPEAMAEVNRLWKELPRSHTYNHLLERFEETYENWDCASEGFEGIRAQDVLPLLLKSFEFEKFIAFGNVIDIFVDRAFGHNFDPENEWDRNFIDAVQAVDDKGIASGCLTPTHLFGVARKESVEAPFYFRQLNPESCIRRAA